MMFNIFIKACEKHEFNFDINTCGRLTVTLYPRNSFESINIDNGRYYYDLNSLLLDAIKEMKAYRKTRGVR